MATRVRASAGEDVYSGDLARRLVEASDAGGGCFTRDDLASHRSEWVQPISTLFRGHRVYEIPPAGQGVAVLEALGILDGLAVSPVEDADSIHHAIEAIKLALTDAHAYVADPAAVPVPTEGLLDPGFAATRRTQIGPFALDPQPGTPPGSNTVYLAAADASGMMVSFIQSNYAGFGSHVVVPGTGIALQNRGTGFSLHAGHPNELAGGKRPFHTIIPGFLATAEGATVGPFGVMGGRMQAQGHLQVLLNTLVAGDGPQAALDRPRWFWESGRSVVVEDPALVAPLRTRGHDARVADEASFFGRGQIIWRSTAGGYLGGSEPRCDGIVLGL
jgi:gamma-glutamyltranspeptidase/glutathione hydrolase